MAYTDLEGYDVYNDMMAEGGPGLHERRRKYPMAAVLTEYERVVAQVNDHGFKTQGGTWLNWSKFCNPRDVVSPAVGDTVAVQVDKAGFLRRLKILAPAPVSSTTPVESDQLDAPASSNPAASTPTPTPPTEPPAFVGRLEQDARGTIISRLAVLNTATALLSSGGRAATLDEVLATAAILEGWATR